MFTVIVYEKKSRKVILALPLEFENDTYVKQKTTILHKDYGFEVFNNTEPIFVEDADGDICLKQNAFFINSDDL